MSKNKMEIRAFTRQMAEEGRVKYSIDQWYHAEQRLRRTFERHGTNRNLWPEDYQENRNSDEYRVCSVVNSDGEFVTTLEEYLFSAADRTVVAKTDYDKKTGKRTSYDKHAGYDRAIQELGGLKESVEIAIECRLAYPFVTWLTCGSKSNASNNSCC